MALGEVYKYLVTASIRFHGISSGAPGEALP
jgi:hypothetical protein